METTTCSTCSTTFTEDEAEDTGYVHPEAGWVCEACEDAEHAELNRLVRPMMNRLKLGLPALPDHAYANGRQPV